MNRILAAIDDKRGMAKENKLPWNLPTDVKRYRDLMNTYGGNILVGRSTYMQMKDVLKNNNVYLATTTIDAMEGVHIVKDIKDFLGNFNQDLWIIGGAKVFEDSISFADELILTRVEGDFNCDVFFPDFENEFVEFSKEDVMSENGVSFQFVNYRKR
jgi:dihydrofolate reductase